MFRLIGPLTNEASGTLLVVRSRFIRGGEASLRRFREADYGGRVEADL
jgi:hypothetical protein